MSESPEALPISQRYRRRGKQLTKRQLPPKYPTEFLYASSPKRHDDRSISDCSTFNFKSSAYPSAIPRFIRSVADTDTSCLDTIYSDTNHLETLHLETTLLETIERETIDNETDKNETNKNETVQLLTKKCTQFAKKGKY
jgi:hypothetical protein